MSKSEDYLAGLQAGLALAGRWNAIASPQVYLEALRMRSRYSGKGGRRRLPGNFIACLADRLSCTPREASALAAGLEKAGLLSKEWGRWYVVPIGSSVRSLIET